MDIRRFFNTNNTEYTTNREKLMNKLNLNYDLRETINDIFFKQNDNKFIKKFENKMYKLSEVKRKSILNLTLMTAITYFNHIHNFDEWRELICIYQYILINYSNLLDWKENIIEIMKCVDFLRELLPYLNKNDIDKQILDLYNDVKRYFLKLMFYNLTEIKEIYNKLKKR